jgi:hypothetical protein
MKKYTDEHLEGIQPESIVSFEWSIFNLINGNHELSLSTCPFYLITNHRKLGSCYYCSQKLIYDRPKNLDSETRHCPCVVFGKEKSIEIMKNLVTQWREWAELNPED